MSREIASKRPRASSSDLGHATIDDELDASDVAISSEARKDAPLAVSSKVLLRPSGTLSTTLSASCLIGSSVMPEGLRQPEKGITPGRCRMRKCVRPGWELAEE